MVRRTNWVAYGYLAFALIILLLSWETNISNAAVADSGIPQDAIRIRIIANSDTIADQTVKRVIRDQVAQELGTWITDPADIDAARNEINGHLDEIRTLVGNTLTKRGFTYDYRVEFGRTDFPEKMFGARLYPAADYEAVKVTLGEGKGKNWWCVLFPPLCFADAVAKKKEQATETVAAAKSAGDEKSVGASDKTEGKVVAKTVAKGDAAAEAKSVQDEGKEKKPKVRFFLIDLIMRLIHWIKSLFA